MTKRPLVGGERLTAEFFNAETLAVAESLLGKLLVHRPQHDLWMSGIIVEVEAYLHRDDPASHSHRGPSVRNASMFAAAGTLYVYTIHAKYCANVVTEPLGVGAAVLIRAIEPYEGIAAMMRHRQINSCRLLSSGPARLCQALAVNKQLDGRDLKTSDQLWLEMPPPIVASHKWQARSSARIGISQGQNLPYRYFVDGNLFVSGKVRDHSLGNRWSFTNLHAARH